MSVETTPEFFYYQKFFCSACGLTAYHLDESRYRSFDNRCTFRNCCSVYLKSDYSIEEKIRKIIVNSIMNEPDYPAMIKYLKENDCPWVIKVVLLKAILIQDYEVIYWCDSNGSKWDKETVGIAIANNRIDVVKYLCENGCPWDNDSALIASAHGHNQILTYLLSIGCIPASDCINNAIVHDRLECFELLHKNGCELTSDAFKHAADSNRLVYLKYLCKNGCAYDEMTTSYSASVNSLECLKYLCEVGISYNSVTMKYAVIHGSIHCVKYLHSIGCDWGEEAIKYSINNTDNIDCLSYLIENGGVITDEVFINAIEKGHLKHIDYLYSKASYRLQDCMTLAMQKSIERGRLDILKYLHEKVDSRIECKIQNNLSPRLVSQHFDCIFYAIENGFSWDEEILSKQYARMFEFIEKRHVRILLEKSSKTLSKLLKILNIHTHLVETDESIYRNTVFKSELSEYPFLKRFVDKKKCKIAAQSRVVETMSIPEGIKRYITLFL